MGLVPARAAKAASERRRPAWDQLTSTWAALRRPTPGTSNSQGAAARTSTVSSACRAIWSAGSPGRRNAGSGWRCCGRVTRPAAPRERRRSAPRGWPMAATRAVVALRLVLSSARTASRSPRRRGMAGRSWPSASRAARTASSASRLAPLRLAGRLGRPTSTTHSPRCCNTAVRPAPKLPAPSTAHRRRPTT
jgi:hypothetical protein